MSKELNKAPVEHAGGDEGAAFFKHLIGRHPAHETELAQVIELNCAAWNGWQARAALAQPSPVRSSLLINGYQLRAALEFIAPDGTAKQLESEARIEWRQQDADFLEAGLYAWCAEYPEEGCVLLDEEPATAQPSPASDLDPLNLAPHAGAFNEAPDEALRPEQAEAERPEVVGYLDIGAGGYIDIGSDLTNERLSQLPMGRHALVIVGTYGVDGYVANDELMTVAQHAASVARWAEMFNRVEQERDAALARVSGLRSLLNPILCYVENDIERMRGDRDKSDNKEIYDLAISLAMERLKAAQHAVFTTEPGCDTAVELASHITAQAQHSVPEGLRELLEMLVVSDLRKMRYAGAWRREVHNRASSILALLAAAPGNSVPQAWLDVQAERRRQVEAEGWTPEHDDAHSHGEMALAAASYAAYAHVELSGDLPMFWPWGRTWWKPTTPRRDLVKACALGLAEIERLDRAASPGKEGV